MDYPDGPHMDEEKAMWDGSSDVVRSQAMLVASGTEGAETQILPESSRREHSPVSPLISASETDFGLLSSRTWENSFCGSKLSDLWQFVTEATGKKSNWLFRTAFLGLKQRKFLLANKMAAHRMFTRAPRIRRIKKTDLSIWSEVPWCIVTSAQWNDRTLAVGFLLIIYTLGTRDCVIFTHLSIFTKTKDNLAKPLI